MGRYVVGYEEVGVGDSAVGLTAATYGGATAARIQVDGGAVRVRVDGTNPTVSTGELFRPGEQFIVYNAEGLQRFRAIRAESENATLRVVYDSPRHAQSGVIERVGGGVEVHKGPRATKTATIADGDTDSEVIDCRGYLMAQVHLDSGFDGTSLKPQGSMDGVTFADIYPEDDLDGAAVTLTVAASRIYEIPKATWGLPYLRFIAGTAQTGPTTLTVSLV